MKKGESRSCAGLYSPQPIDQTRTLLKGSRGRKTSRVLTSSRTSPRSRPDTTGESSRTTLAYGWPYYYSSPKGPWCLGTPSRMATRA